MSFTAPYRAGANDAFALPSRQGNNFLSHRAPISLASSVEQVARSALTAASTNTRKSSPLDGRPFTTRPINMTHTAHKTAAPKAPKAPPKYGTAAKVTDYKVTRDPFPEARASIGSKYDELFSSLSAGDSIPCEPERVSALANMLRVHVARHRSGAALVVRSAASYSHPVTGEDDGLGRVWLLAAPNKAKAKK